MNIGERVMIALYTIAVAAAALIIAFMPYNLVPSWNIENLTDYINGNVLVTLVALGFLLFSMGIFFSALKTDKKKRSIMKFTNLGEVRVSFNAIEGLTLKTIRQFPNVRDAKILIDIEGESLVIVVKAVVTADTNIPQITQDIQNNVKDYVEKYSGIGVKHVQVQVEGIWETSRARVQ